ncbi:hypothetical protein [Oceanobacillus damuensis]|uniref:hypothetical protein n=1 Tax=Oceanobacillus damuensis TaxID=937928 RepID=UPI000832C669|nr:hypothetical protein [Oceanobacillus damuensis]
MMKGFQLCVTPGVESYLQSNVLNSDNLMILVQKSIKHGDASYFFAFKKNRHTTLVTDGDNQILDELWMVVPEQIWIIAEEYETERIYIVILPREY